MAELGSETARGSLDRQQSHSTPTLLVERFLDMLGSKDIEGAAELLAVDVQYTNVGLPTVRGRKRVRRLLRAALAPGAARFEVYMHTISADGSSVLTERTDVLKFGRLRIQFWVCGRFDVQDGQIVLWRDYFDQMNIMAATARGLLGVVFPAARAKPPTSQR